MARSIRFELCGENPVAELDEWNERREIYEKGRVKEAEELRELMCEAFPAPIRQRTTNRKFVMTPEDWRQVAVNMEIDLRKWREASEWLDGVLRLLTWEHSRAKANIRLCAAAELKGEGKGNALGKAEEKAKSVREMLEDLRVNSKRDKLTRELTEAQELVKGEKGKFKKLVNKRGKKKYEQLLEKLNVVYMMLGASGGAQSDFEDNGRQKRVLSWNSRKKEGKVNSRQMW